MVRSRSNTPLLLAAVGIALVGGISVQMLGNAASQPTTAAASDSIVSNISGVSGAGTHSEVQPHSPNVLSAGDCHIEAQLSKEGKLELYIYGQKERQLYPISTMGLDLAMEAQAVIPGESSVPIQMKALPYPNEPEGTSSRFIGQFDRLPEQEMVGLSLTIPIDEKTYRVQWRPENLVPGLFAQADPGMPQAVSSDTASRLFLTPGGLYTTEDIAANGRMTATQKYGNQMSMHNAHPKPGDRLCPITDTVANPKFSWIVGGETYRFCCPPCIEEFVKQAKEKPESVKAPETYVQKA